MPYQACQKSRYDTARELVENTVPQHIKRWAAIIALTPTYAGFSQFREDVTEALHACMRAHIAKQCRPHERFSDLRKEFVALANAATKTAKLLRRAEGILKRLPPMHHDPAFRLAHDPRSTAIELDGLAEASRRHADECKRADRGGRPRMRAFEALAEGLIRAYRRAAKRKGTGGNVREGASRLRKLVEAVLPTARELAKEVTGKPLQRPISGNLGEHLDEIARRLQGA